MARKIVLVVLIAFAQILSGCNHKMENIAIQFEVLDSSSTGLNFSNQLKPSASFNMFNYMYFYNGAGIGAGDFNNDGLIDLFFTSNQSQNRLYINKGSLQFSDVTEAANIPLDSSWSTGVSVADVNGDGLLDIYVCRVGNFEILHSKNQLLICQGITNEGVPFYKDEAAAYGLDFCGFSTQASFFDYDLDGDLDLFLMNHGVRNIGTFGERSRFLGTYDLLSGHRMYRNDNNRFTDVTKQAAIHSSSIGYGLGLCVSDINMDGWPDMYIGNDFHENDYLYINQKDGSFKDLLTEQVNHTSQFSMGVDVADINNDILPDIISMDMLPADPYILKRSLGEDEYNLFNMKLRYGYMPQYARNNLQLNMGNGHFSEIGRYAGVYATDWSWAALWTDFDNDGWKDLFISNGIPKRLNDMDYVNYVSNAEVQEKIRSGKMTDYDMALIDKFPEIKLPNKFFRNNGNTSFSDIATAIKGDRPTYSNGSVYADLDNDGDLDIVVNNIDNAALIYQNKGNDSGRQRFLALRVRGDSSNVYAVGAKLIAYCGSHTLIAEKYPVHGFQSSMEVPLHLGLGSYQPDSIRLIWPDNSFVWLDKNASSYLSMQYQKGGEAYNYEHCTNNTPLHTNAMEDIASVSGIQFTHEENSFVEFDREPLIPHMVSKEGPALAVGDINNDGMDDFFIGGARGQKGAIFLQLPSGRFTLLNLPAMAADSNYEDISACWVDVNNDNFCDLVVASGGNEYYGANPNNTPRVYINNAKGGFYKQENAFSDLYLTAACIAACDVNNDGYNDLFIGARATPFEYGSDPASYLLLNDKTGRFTDVTAAYSKDLLTAGLVTDAVWYDIDNDKRKDLLLTCEWGGINAYLNKENKLEKKELTNKKGWWNCVLPCDIDNDGDIDLVAGNLGWNSRLKASEKWPVKLYINDFDDNGKNEQILTYYLQGKEIPFANKGELEKQMPLLKKKFLYAGDFAKASLQDIFSKEKLAASTVQKANCFSNAIFINNGNLNFTMKELPWQAQLSCIKGAVVVNANGDNLPDLLIAGNFYANNIQMGRYDASYGSILINKGNGNFVCENINGMVIKGETRHIQPLKIKGRQAYLLAKNNDSLQVIQFKLLRK